MFDRSVNEPVLEPPTGPGPAPAAASRLSPASYGDKLRIGAKDGAREQWGAGSIMK